ncbi:MAG: tetratricopeptide repeat protein [Nitrospirae bacterium]|nr:tetratricopeptide repeat protein [Nitrospirota bacterium]MBF0535995.1 tetratricopeptide repeat protein [Nitrospirota bacterium]MBF0617884.1 tetratricopeptide repeat protein [Nitrospirota bacterium]
MLTDLDSALSYLGNLTLIEISTVKTDDTETVKYYFVTPIIADLLKEHDGLMSNEDTLKKTGFPLCMGSLSPGNDKEGITSFSVIPAEAGIHSLKVNFSDKLAGDYYDDVVNNFDGGLTEHEEAFYHYHKARVKEKINEIGSRLSRYYYDSSLYSAAFHYCKAVYELLGLESDLHVLNYLGLILQLYCDLDGALKIFLEVEKITKAKGDKQQEGAILSNIGQIYHVKGDYDSALKYLLDSLKLSKQINNKKGDGVTLNNIGEIYRVKGDYYSALKYMRDSLKNSKEIGDKQQEGITLNNISLIYDAKRDYDEALKYLLESLKIAREIGDKQQEGAALNNISQIYDAKGDYDRALQYLLESLKISKEIGDTFGVANALFNLAALYEATGKPAESAQCLKDVTEINKTLKSYEVSQALKRAGIEG